MLGQNKLQKERNQKMLLELLLLPGNNICADCKARNPRWTSHNLGIFLCMHCASIHRKIGTHVTKVKSLTMDDWTREQVETMKSIGNIKSNAIYNPNELRYPPPPNLEDSERDSELEQYIRSKYQYKKFLNKSALVASKLGSSKSASSVQKPALESSKSQVSTSTDQALTASVGVPTKRPILPPVQAGLAKANTPDPSPSTEKKSTAGPSTSSVWNDLSSLATPGQNSSLPLQYQSSNTVGPTQLQSSTFNGATANMSYPIGVTSTGMGINPFQAQMGLTPSQQPMLSPFTPSHSPSVSTLFNNAQSQQPFGQPWVTHSTQPGPVMTQPAFFQPQPQLSVQLQTAPVQSIMSYSPNQQFLSGPMNQSQYLLPNPSQQFRSHSSQAEMQPLQPMRTSSGFLLQSPMSAQVNMAGMTTPGQPSFLGTTTMQMMQQQQMLQQQQAMFGAPQVHPMAANRMGPENPFGGQMYNRGSQWGAM